MVSMGCRPSAKIAVTIGNFIPEKGHLRLLDSLSVYLHQYPEWQCLWIGEHHFTYPDVVKRIQELGLQDRILCPGAVPKAGQNISGADLYLLPSLTEAFPTVLLEARLAGVPFLATDCGGAKEIAEAGGGWCAEYGSHFNEQLQSCFKGQLNAPVCNSSAFTMQSMATSY
jgi:glycosyltransferase involved in cell wall biosynthesis